MCALRQTVLFDPLDGDERAIGDSVEFRLLYSGELLGASRSDTRAKHKHAIRKQFHPQLERLWQTNYSVRNIAWMVGHDALTEANEDRVAPCPPTHQELEERGKQLIGDRWNRCGYKFYPIVTESFDLRCELDILFLRNEPAGKVINCGDIDNRLKTIFDALRLPAEASEMGNSMPGRDETPFYCLLEDDRLISKVTITADQLLLLPDQREIGPNDAHLVITVNLKPRTYSIEGLRFL